MEYQILAVGTPGTTGGAASTTTIRHAMFYPGGNTDLELRLQMPILLKDLPIKNIFGIPTMFYHMTSNDMLQVIGRKEHHEAVWSLREYLLQQTMRRVWLLPTA